MYSDHYGLIDRPFQLTPDRRFFFRGATHGRAIDRIETALTRGEGCMVVIGDSGTGKTMLAHQIQAEGTESNILRAGEVEGGDLLALISRGSGGDVLVSEQGTLLVIDDAQNLAPAALRQLISLFDRPEPREAPLQIVLLGRPELQERLQSAELEELRRHIIVTHRLTQMGADEVEPYLHHRLTTAGWTGIPSFMPDALVAVHGFSQGLPRRINMVASRLLLLGAIERLKMIDGEAVGVVIADFQNDPSERIADLTAYQPPDRLPTASILSELPAAGPHLAGLIPEAGDVDLAERVSALELRVADQDEMLRRILTLLVEWVEHP